MDKYSTRTLTKLAKKLILNAYPGTIKFFTVQDKADPPNIYWKWQYEGPDSECSCCDCTYFSASPLLPEEKEQLEKILERLQADPNVRKQTGVPRKRGGG